jgi:hypothetical protein
LDAFAFYNWSVNSETVPSIERTERLRRLSGFS